jgi:hypothetical protein
MNLSYYALSCAEQVENVHEPATYKETVRCADSENCCWLVPVVFPLHIGGVFHVKSCVSAIDLVLLHIPYVVHISFIFFTL